MRAIRGYFPALTPEGEVVSTQRIRSYREVQAGAGEDRSSPLRATSIEGGDPRTVFAPPSGIAWGTAVAREAGWGVTAVGTTFGPEDADVDVWKFRLDGTDAVNLTEDFPGNDALPSISADGRVIAFRSSRSERGEMSVYILEGDASAPRRLTDSTERETMPAVSPDGEWIVYVSFREEYVAKLWLCRTDGSERRLLEPDRADVPDLSMHPRFSPDGRWIVFTSDRAGMNDEFPLSELPQPYGELWAVPLVGGPAVRLTHDKWEDGPCDWGYARVPGEGPRQRSLPSTHALE